MSPRGIRTAIEKRQNASQVFHQEGGALSRGDGREYISMNVFYSRFSQGSRLSLDALQAMEKGQALETLKDRVKQDTMDALRFLNFSAFGNGEGVRGVNSGSVASATTLNVTFKAPGYAKAMQLQGRYDVHDASTKAKKNTSGPLTLTALDKVAGTGTFVAPAALSLNDDDIFVKEGSYGLDIAGLQYLVDDATTGITGDFFGVPRSTDNVFRAVVDRSGGALSVAKLNFVVQQFKFKKGVDAWNPKDYIIVMSPSQFNRYLNLGDPTVNATNSGVRLTQTVSNGKLDLGYNPSGLFFQGIDIVEDDSCPNDEVYFVHKPSIKKGEFIPLRAYSLLGDGQTLNRVPAFDSGGVGTYLDQSILYLSWKGNLYTTNPSGFIRLTGLDTTGLADGRI
jgi:hypothetical protein